MKYFSHIQNESGSLVVDFLFSFTLVFAFVMIMFSLAMTLTAAEMTQYLTYSAARVYSASHITRVEQQEAGQAKYQQLLNSPGYRILNSGGWFSVDPNATIGDATTVMVEYAQSGTDPNSFHGAFTNFTAKILASSLPGFGSTAPNDDGSGDFFSTTVGSYLGREPTAEECQDFNGTQRMEAILNLPAVEGFAPYNSATTSATSMIPISDNGC